jgi:iron complex outermembrane receptor protein
MFWANARYNITSTQNEISESFGEVVTPGYETLDLRFGAKPFKDFSVGIAVLNVFDEAYNNHLNFSLITKQILEEFL